MEKVQWYSINKKPKGTQIIKTMPNNACVGMALPIVIDSFLRIRENKKSIASLI